MNQITKNIKKNINMFAVAAMIVAGGLTMAFKAPSHYAEIEYGKHLVGGTVEWIPLSSLDQKPSNSPLASGEYACDQSSQNCSAFFPDSMTPDSSTPDPGNGDQGTFRYNP